MAALLAAFDVFALSSLSEGISLTLLEAASAGLPIVATRVGGNDEVVIDGESGVLVPAADPGAFCRGARGGRGQGRPGGHGRARAGPRGAPVQRGTDGAGVRRSLQEVLGVA